MPVDFFAVLKDRVYAAEEVQRLADLEAADVERDLEAFKDAVAAQGEKARIVRESIGAEAAGMTVELLAHIYDEALAKRWDGVRQLVSPATADIIARARMTPDRRPVWKKNAEKTQQILDEITARNDEIIAREG